MKSSAKTPSRIQTTSAQKDEYQCFFPAISSNFILVLYYYFFLQIPNLFSCFLEVRHGSRDQFPEFFGVIEFFKMAKLVDDHIIEILLGKMDDAIIQTYISIARTAPPAGFLTAGGNFG